MGIMFCETDSSYPNSPGSESSNFLNCNALTLFHPGYSILGVKVPENGTGQQKVVWWLIEKKIGLSFQVSFLVWPNLINYPQPVIMFLLLRSGVQILSCLESTIIIRQFSFSSSLLLFALISHKNIFHLTSVKVTLKHIFLRNGISWKLPHLL